MYPSSNDDEICQSCKVIPNGEHEKFCEPVLEPRGGK